MKFEIKTRITGATLFTAELEAKFESEPSSYQLGEAIKQAVKAGANLAGANLDGANLARAYLDGANLARANLAGAYLAGANLDGANLARANLDGAYLDGAYLARAYLDGANLARANLDGANLAGANLAGANLDGANLDGAYLAGANLADANLAGANLDGANLDGAYLDGAYLARAYLDGANLAGAKNLPEAALAPIRNDLWDVLLRARGEVPFLLSTLRAGKVDGSTYEGDCACLVGTIANGCGKAHDELANDLVPNSGRPIERWFMAIKPGHTPEKSEIARITEGWIVEFMKLAGIEEAQPAA